MKKELLDILQELKYGDLTTPEAHEKIFDLFRVSKRTILNAGDKLPEYNEEYRKEAEKIKKVLVDKGFINAGLNNAIGLWGQYSDDNAAGWLGVDEDPDDIFRCIEKHIYVTHKYYD